MMNKATLIKETATKTGFTQKNIKEVLDALQEVVFDNMKEGVKVFDGVTLDAVYKDAHEARNPATGETVTVAAKYMPHAKFGSAIREAIN